MTSREAFEAAFKKARPLALFDSWSKYTLSYSNEYINIAWLAWQVAIEWASKQASEAIAGVRASEEDDVYNSWGNDIAARCETATKKALK